MASTEVTTDWKPSALHSTKVRSITSSAGLVSLGHGVTARARSAASAAHRRRRSRRAPATDARHRRRRPAPPRSCGRWPPPTRVRANGHGADRLDERRRPRGRWRRTTASGAATFQASAMALGRLRRHLVRVHFVARARRAGERLGQGCAARPAWSPAAPAAPATESAARSRVHSESAPSVSPGDQRRGWRRRRRGPPPSAVLPRPSGRRSATDRGGPPTSAVTDRTLAHMRITGVELEVGQGVASGA